MSELTDIKKQWDKIRLNCELPNCVMVKVTPVYNKEFLDSITRGGREQLYILEKKLADEQIYL